MLNPLTKYIVSKHGILKHDSYSVILVMYLIFYHLYFVPRAPHDLLKQQKGVISHSGLLVTERHCLVICKPEGQF